MNDLYDGRALCPFYIKETRTEQQGEMIVCEGFLTQVCCNCFSDRDKKKKFATRFCCNAYKNCEHYRTVMRVQYSERERADCI